jgi:pyrroline-5-carboxylate reductase
MNNPYAPRLCHLLTTYFNFQKTRINSERAIFQGELIIREVKVMSLKNRSIAFIGAGHITEIIVSNLTKSDSIIPRRLIASDPVHEKLETLKHQYGISLAEDNSEAVYTADYVFICVLPNRVGEVVEELKSMGFPEDKTIITLAGGIPMDTYEPIGERLPVVRALPNPPSQIGKGVAALAFNPYVDEVQKTDIFELFGCLGDYVVIREDLINAVMALSSPAVTYMVFQSLIDAGIRAGIDYETSARIVSQTIVGAMEVWKKRDVAAHELLTEASTPGGISIESVFTLEKYSFKAALMEAIESAIKKAEDLSREVQ